MRALVLSLLAIVAGLSAATHSSAETLEFHYAPGIVGAPLSATEAMEVERLLEANTPSVQQSAVISQGDVDALMKNLLQSTPSAGDAIVDQVHGCHQKRCVRVCPICTFPRATDTKGHCRQGGLLRACFKRR